MHNILNRFSIFLYTADCQITEHKVECYLLMIDVRLKTYKNSDRIIIDAVVIIDSEIFQYKQKREHDDDGPKEYGCEHEYKR